MVGVDSDSLQVDSQPKSSGLVLGWRPLGAILHSSNEPGKLSQWLCDDDSTINIGICIIIHQNYHKTVKNSASPSDVCSASCDVSVLTVSCLDL